MGIEKRSGDYRKLSAFEEREPSHNATGSDPGNTARCGVDCLLARQVESANLPTALPDATPAFRFCGTYKAVQLQATLTVSEPVSRVRRQPGKVPDFRGSA